MIFLDGLQVYVTIGFVFSLAVTDEFEDAMEGMCEDLPELPRRLIHHTLAVIFWPVIFCGVMRDIFWRGF